MRRNICDQTSAEYRPGAPSHPRPDERYRGALGDDEAAVRSSLRGGSGHRQGGRSGAASWQGFEGGGGLFAIEGSPESPKPADGEPSETEPVPLPDPQGTQN